MSYTPTQWKSGDTVTSAKLNKMEQGIASGKNILIVGATMANNIITLDKTWQEIFDADIAYIVAATGENRKAIEFVTSIGIYNTTYSLMTNSDYYEAQSADDYPVTQGGK